jgi:hypothetical protein
MIDEILDEFDFEKVHRVMVALDWEVYIDGEKTIPSIGDLRRRARSLLQHVVNSKDTAAVSTIGFTAYMHYGVLGLRFEVSSYEIELEKGIGQ